MDAAVDNMIPYGFSEELVKKTVNELLEVGIFFILFKCFFEI